MATDTTAAAPVAPSHDAVPTGEPRTRRRARALLLPLAIVVVAALIRFIGLDHPERIYFDETYYAPQGQEMITRGVEEGFAVHPPVGKWLIGAGIAVFGYDSFGFRAASAVAGSITVLLTYLIGVRLVRRRGVAALAAFFVAIDGLTFTMSRIAMLDIFLAMFVAAGVWLLLIDRDDMWRDVPVRAADEDRPLPRRSHRWRWVAGIAFGLALATKWSAVIPLGGAIAFLVVSELLWRRRVTGSPWTGWWRAAGSVALTFLVVPVLVYVASYVGWFTNYSETRLGLEQCPQGECSLSTVDIARQWWGEQGQIADFHRTLEADHPYRSNPATWIYLGRPVAYYYESCDDEKLADGECVTERGNVEEILGIGNPAIWWLAIPAIPLALWFGVRRRDWRAFALVGFYAVQYGFWLAVYAVGTLTGSDAGRPNFLFYLTPAVPFLCLTLAYVLWRATEHPFLRWIPAAVGGLAVAAFVFWYPVWTGMEMPQADWQLRMWWRSWI